MITRADDSDEQVRQHRLEVYARESKPLLDYYRGRPTFRSINGAQAPDQVAQELAAQIDTMVACRLEEAVMIVCRSASELRRLRDVNQLVGQVLEQLREAVAPGVTTEELDAHCGARDPRRRARCRRSRVTRVILRRFARRSTSRWCTVFRRRRRC